jgi:hypothetical protein
MTFTVTIEGIFLLLLGLVGLAVGSYLLVVLKNVNHLILDFNKTLTKNEEKIDKLLIHLEELSENSAYFSGELKKQFDNNKLIVGSIFQTGAESMFLLKDATGKIRSLVANFNEIIKLVNRFFKK